MIDKYIIIKGARVHNLKNIDVNIPRNKLIVITGVSGSGKSSLAFDTLYAEGQRRYIESLSSYARNFLGSMKKPDVDKIEGISPAISIDQRKAISNPRSTVGTMTEVLDYLRLLYARVGKPHCHQCGDLISSQTNREIFDRILRNFKGSIIILGPIVQSKKGEHYGALQEIKKNGYVRVRVDSIIYTADQATELTLEQNKEHSIEIIIDELMVNDRQRLKDSLAIALRIGKGSLIISSHNKDTKFNTRFSCQTCDISLPELKPRLFSFNSPFGSCEHCTGLGEKLEIDPELIIPNLNLTIAEGAIAPQMRSFNKIGKQSSTYKQLTDLASKYNFSLDVSVRELSKEAIAKILYGDDDFSGVIKSLEKKYLKTSSDWTRQEIEQYMVTKICSHCAGKRLRPEALAVTFADHSIDQLTSMSIENLRKFFKGLSKKDLTVISEPIILEIINRSDLLIKVGLSYLTLSRKTSTLSGGEAQRIKLSIQIGSKLTGVLYVLDEPSIGLHPKDHEKLIKTLFKLRDFANTVIIVEHDIATIKSCDWIIDIGPGAGKYGGEVIFEGTLDQLKRADTLTAKYLSGKLKVGEGKKSNIANPKFLTIKGASENNLKNIDVSIPTSQFVCITGVSGSGKSSLMNDILAKALLKKFYHAKEEPGKHKEIIGTELFNKVVLVDQSPIGKNSRSNPATYTGIFLYIRELFSKTRLAKTRNYTTGLFSFNVDGGRCKKCEGQGEIKIEMYFMPDVYIDCAECNGKRYNDDILEVLYKGKNISEVLNMTVEEAGEFFKETSGLNEKLKTLKEVGLSYIQLGQPAPSLSGGEAQRVKLSTELSRKSYGKTLYILDEPTTGLHLDDISRLIKVIRKLTDKGNTVVSIEHNTDFIRCADWVIDLGPEGGDKGGEIVAEGRPEDIKKVKRSYTGRYL